MTTDRSNENSGELPPATPAEFSFDALALDQLALAAWSLPRLDDQDLSDLPPPAEGELPVALPVPEQYANLSETEQSFLDSARRGGLIS